MSSNQRDYGLGDFTKFIIGRPRLAKTMKMVSGHPVSCPNCKLDTVAEIQVVLHNLPVIRAEFAIGTYLSCPACPWAAPVLVVGTDSVPDWLKF